MIPQRNGLIAVGFAVLFPGASLLSAELPLFELEEVETVYSETGFAPEYAAPAPRFTYYEAPALPRGELILALEFMDRYRESTIPGSVKWGGILHFPVIDGYERPHLKWLCLYFYGDRMFGYDPAARYEADRRFAAPIRYEDRLKPEILLQFAESYVESVFAGSEEELFMEDDDWDEAESGRGSSGFNTIPPGRIAPAYASQRDLEPKDLVRLIYQFSADPDPAPEAAPPIGPGEDYRPASLSWRSLWRDLGATPDYLEVARELVAPRWGQKVVFHYTRNLLFLFPTAASEQALLFNVGIRVFAYNPRFGVWRTEATVHDLADPASLPAKVRFPGIRSVERLEFVPLAAAEF